MFQSMNCWDTPPQLTNEDIKKMYHKFSHEFAVKPFDEVMEQCNQAIKEYYSCFPLLLSMIQLLLNHSTLAKTEDTKKEILQQCILLSQRVKDESESIRDIKNANSMEALAEMALGNSEEVIRLLNDQLVPYSGDDIIQRMPSRKVKIEGGINYDCCNNRKSSWLYS